MSAPILKQTSWTDKNISLLVHEIIEYDMRDGGLSIIKEDKLLPPDMIEKMAALPKGVKRNTAIGKLRHTKEYSEVPKLQQMAFEKYRLMFGEANDLEDEDILSIKKDAIFTKKYCYELTFGNYIEFREKNIYQLYFTLTTREPRTSNRRRLEFYWSEDGHIDIKGIENSRLERHKKFTTQIIWNVCEYLVNYDKEGAIRYLVSFMNKYKLRRLEPDYYRGFNDLGIYPVHLQGRELLLDDIGQPLLENTDISYNYEQIYVPLLQLIVA